MKILAVDTTTAACSAALLIDKNIAAEYALTPREHHRLILPMVDKLLADATLSLIQLDAIAFACGPGSFTGVRMSASVAQALAFSHSLPVVRISTLRAIAQRMYREQQATHVLSVLDARMQEVYWGAYVAAEGVMQLAGEEHVSAPGAVVAPFSADWFVTSEHLPDAYDVAYLAQYDFQRGLMVKAEEALPVYLRDQVV